MELSVRAAPSSPEGQDALDMLRGTGMTLTLVGGDGDALTRWTSAARSAGFTRVVVAPGPAALTGEALAQLVAAGVGAIEARLYAADSAAHDWHARLEGSFRATTTLLRAARALRVAATVRTPLTRSNARVLAALPGLLVDVAAVGWCVEVIAEDGREPAGGLIPRLGAALPYALQAIAAAERAGLAAAVAGAPACLLGPLRDRGVPGPPRAFAGCCDDCELRGGCVGIDARYLQRFGAGELAARRGTAEPAAAGPRAKRLQDMFSGPCLEIAEGACWPI
ncbi:hypothetical protein [Nannocystis pusilla]|uniref:Radical SAM protein n=1 Tax=Nannocystis pusilla TaxID=889268 RepID=A0ABS7TXZ1_9BACT|nr:hypothetical protein [Nannocystis pusilla]MBZ5713143.1 hypothetical protein [Nannocystis pusilla]